MAKFKIGDIVEIPDLNVTGKIINHWPVKKDNEIIENYIIKDVVFSIEHEYYENEIRKVK